MKSPNFGPYHIRKWYLQIEDALATESGMPADGAPLRKIVVGAVLHNPYAGRHEDNLGAYIEPSNLLGAEFGRRARAPPPGSERPLAWQRGLSSS